MKYEVNYIEYLEWFRELVEKRNLKTGARIQDVCLHDTDEDSLSERERFIMILAVAKIEIELEVLTPEIGDEIYFYYEDFNNGVFDGKLGDDEAEIIKRDLFECYKKISG